MTANDTMMVDAMEAFGWDVDDIEAIDMVGTDAMCFVDWDVDVDALMAEVEGE